MAKLMYIANVSVDGFVEDASGNFDWTAPDDEVFAFITELLRPVSTHLYGRRMYETMAVWEAEPALWATSELMEDFAKLWQATDKVVYSTTLPTPTTTKTRLERSFDSDLVRDLKRSAAGDLIVGGPKLAAHAFTNGLVDECHLLVRPVVVGGGKPALPSNRRIDLELADERSIGNGVVYLQYRVRT